MKLQHVLQSILSMLWLGFIAFLVYWSIGTFITSPNQYFYLVLGFFGGIATTAITNGIARNHWGA